MVTWYQSFHARFVFFGLVGLRMGGIVREIWFYFKKKAHGWLSVGFRGVKWELGS
jgi:hypothetical protein